MSDFPNIQQAALPLFINTLVNADGDKLARLAGSGGLTNAARTWVANLIQYNPVVVPVDYPVHRVCWVNGSTVTSTNVQFGIYTADGTLIYTTGTVAMSGASTLQYVTVSTPFILPAGRYYFAWTCNSTTSRGYTITSATTAFNKMAGLLEETPGSFGLPATMTPVTFARAWGFNLCGVTRTTTGY
jgi:hypothetical protein